MEQNIQVDLEKALRLARPETCLSTIILLNTRLNADKIIPFLTPHRPELRVIVVETAEQLDAIPAEILQRARLISVCGTVIVPDRILRLLGFSAYNFHPGPPTYPGWAPFNFAHYDGVESYGTTVHQMTRWVDAGPIVSLDFFAVPPGAGLGDLLRMTKSSLMQQLANLAEPLVMRATPFPALPIPWAARKTTRKEFALRCALSPDLDRGEFRRRVAAFGGGDGYSEPIVTINGRRYRPAPESHDPHRLSDGSTVTLHDVGLIPVED